MTRGLGLGSVVRNLSWKALSLGLERGCRLAITLASAPVLGEAAFGRFVFASAVTAFFALAADLGLATWTTRALARGRADGDLVVRVGLMLRAASTVPYAIAIALVAATAPADARGAVVLLGVAALLGSLADHFGAALRGTERFGLEARMNAVRAVLTLVAGASALAAGRSLTAVSAAVAVSAAGAFVFGAIATLRLHPLARHRGASGEARSMARAALRESLPIWLAGLLSLAYFKVDTLFVRSLAGDAELGAYGAAYKLFEGAMLLPSVVLSVTFPRLVRADGDARARARLERLIAGALLLLGLLVGGVSFFARRPLVALLFGAQFRRAEDSLRVLALGIPLVFVNYGLTHFLVARHRERANTALALMMLVVTVGLDVLLIPGGSGPGAAAATVLAEVALTVSCLVLLRPESSPP
jgi:O-antigen/teichoic acid export membrane protein